MQMIRNFTLAIMVGCGLSWLIGILLLPMLKRLKFGQHVRSDGPQSHLAKEGTPTMGGIMMIGSALAATLLFSGGDYLMAVPALVVSLAYTLIGFLDDFIKIKLKRSLGLRAYQKIILQFGFAIAAAFWIKSVVGTKLYLPISGGERDLGIFFIPFAMFIIIAAVNSVNLTDGLDGLAGSVTSIFMLGMGFAVIVMVNIPQGSVFSSGLQYTGLVAFIGAVIGSCMGFLLHNSYPAKVFMGDTGSFLLGSAVAMVAMLSRLSLLLPIMGFCYVGSSLSVIIQVGSYKLRNKKRVFKMAPIHHHFELMGIKETRIVTAYSVVTALLCALSVLLLAI